MLLNAGKEYGDYWKNAMEYNGLLNNFVKEVKPDAMFFVMFMSQIKKHHTLALLSIPRCHHVQTQMNFRQTIEAATNAAYGVAHYERENFVTNNEDGTIIDTNQAKKYRWLKENFKFHSDFLEKQKKAINRGSAHSSVVYAFLNFGFKSATGFATSFFDGEDKFHTRMELWFAGNLAMGIMDLMAVANKKYDLITLIPDFVQQQKELEQENHRLKAELGGNERIKKWLPLLEERRRNKQTREYFNWRASKSLSRSKEDQARCNHLSNRRFPWCGL